MITLTIDRHADVPTALELVKDEVAKEAKRILSAGGDALKEGNIGPAKQAIAYAEKLKDFAMRIETLGKEWAELQANVEDATPEVQELVRPTRKVSRSRGYKMKPGGTKSPKKGFTVTFRDGTSFCDNVARKTFVRVIARIGAASVAPLGLLVDGEPLVSRTPSNYRNMSSVAQIAGGWLVATHSSTKAKAAQLKKISAALGLDLDIALAE